MLFLILSPYDNEQSDLIHRVSEEKRLDEIPLYRYCTHEKSQSFIIFLH